MSYWQNVQAILKTSGPKPIYTWVSDNGRIELSVVTFANAVSKASNFISEGLELDPGTRVKVALGNHWQSPVWLGTALTTGLSVTDLDPAITFGTNTATQTWPGSPEDFVVVSRDPFGMPDKEIPAGFVNGSAEVRNFGDYFSPAWPVASDHVAIAVDAGEITWEQLAARARELADEYGIKSGQSYGLHGASDLVTLAALQVVLPVVNENSVVLIDQANPDFDAIKKQEKLEQIVMLG